MEHGGHRRDGGARRAGQADGEGCLSYIVASEGGAAVVDPSLPAEVYIGLAAQHGWRIDDGCGDPYSCGPSLPRAGVRRADRRATAPAAAESDRLPVRARRGGDTDPGWRTPHSKHLDSRPHAGEHLLHCWARRPCSQATRCFFRAWGVPTERGCGGGAAAGEAALRVATALAGPAGRYPRAARACQPADCLRRQAGGRPRRRDLGG